MRSTNINVRCGYDLKWVESDLFDLFDDQAQLRSIYSYKIANGLDRVMAK